MHLPRKYYDKRGVKVGVARLRSKRSPPQSLSLKYANPSANPNHSGQQHQAARGTAAPLAAPLAALPHGMAGCPRCRWPEPHAQHSGWFFARRSKNTYSQIRVAFFFLSISPGFFLSLFFASMLFFLQNIF